MFGEDDKILAGDLANYNWKIFACSFVFDNILLESRYGWLFLFAGRLCDHAGWYHDF
jgi:hypothetical protein